jgi:Lectin C-type domain
MNWEDALLYCEGRGMNLATFDSREEAKYFNSIAGKEVWVGITDQKEEGKFIQITDDQEADIPWNAGEPNNFNDDENCVQSGFDGGFNDNDCKSVIRFACERVEYIEEFEDDGQTHQFI